MVDPHAPSARGAVAPPLASESGGRAPLDRGRIIATAIDLVDRQGLKALTMRRLGDDLGVEGMAIYHHIPGREALLDGIVETVIDQLYADPDVHMNDDVGWQEFLLRLAHGVRRIALAHPEVFPLVCTRPPAAPWVRPPLRSLRWMESFLATLQRCGFRDVAAVKAYQIFSSYLLGALLLEVAHRGVDIGPVTEVDVEAPPATDLAEYPTLKRLQQEMSQERGAEIFAESLEVLIDHLEHLGKK